MTPVTSTPSCPLADLPADGPLPALAEALMLFGQFVGAWDVDMEFYDDSGRRVSRRAGTWSFGWVLDGRAIQDVLIYPMTSAPDAAAPGARGIGTSLRYFDPNTDKWHVIWVGAVTGVIVTLHAEQVDDEIHLHSEPEPDGTLNHWMFTDITTDSFLWKGYESGGGGETWRLRQIMRASRRG